MTAAHLSAGFMREFEPAGNLLLKKSSSFFTVDPALSPQGSRSDAELAFELPHEVENVIKLQFLRNLRRRIIFERQH